MNNHSLESIRGLKEPAYEIIESHPVIGCQLLHVQKLFPVYENGRLLDIGVPCHPYLLDTDFTVNDELVKTGYAVKPIAGRCGSNIDLVSHHEEVLDKTSGKFAEQKNIYQQLWCLPKVDGKYIQVCTFTVGGNYGGTCLRGDESLVIKKESDIEPLIVVKK